MTEEAGYPYLSTLNKAQKKAVLHSPSKGGLQILAGPGSGKTKVLTTRVAYLLNHHKIDPANIIVVTFTNKAANEMKERLKVLVGQDTVGKLIMGTFHSVCVRYLRRYYPLLPPSSRSLPSSFLITSRDDTIRTLTRLISQHPQQERIRDVKLNANGVCEVIGRCKSNELGVEEYRSRGFGGDGEKGSEIIADIYEAYEEQLRRDNAVDFDDLLLLGLQLLRANPHLLNSIKTVLIDEFQDTNTVQFALVRCLASTSGSLTVVGDPDQSIYGWRHAKVENLELMASSFTPLTRIFLEENYRSTGAILGCALSVVTQDTTRIQKSLLPTHPPGLSTILHSSSTAAEEADWIARSIKLFIAHSGGDLVDYGDVAILLRYGALSRNVEQSLRKEGIPCRIVGGVRFFERVEVRDLLSYLQLLSAPSFTPAFSRVINVPKRGLGEKTVGEFINLSSTNSAKGKDIWDVLVKVSECGLGSFTDGQRRSVREFVKTIRGGKKLAEQGATVPELIDFILESTQYLQHLEKNYTTDHKDRLDNINELKSYAVGIQSENPVEVRAVGSLEDDDQEAGDTPLTTFLAVSMLATDSETESSDDAKARKVTISTCHAAKGLEWPIVFVPACEDGTYPFFRCQSDAEKNEERRLLFVAITRAKILCHLSHSTIRMSAGRTEGKSISPFLAPAVAKYPTLFVDKLQTINQTKRVELAKVLGRPVPSEEQAKIAIQNYEATLPAQPTEIYPSNMGYSSSQPTTSYAGKWSQGGGFINHSSSWNNNLGGSSKWGTGWKGASTGFRPAGSGPAPVPANSGFQSALKTYKAPEVNVTTAGFEPASSSTHSTSLSGFRPGAATSKASIPTASTTVKKSGFNAPRRVPIAPPAPTPTEPEPEPDTAGKKNNTAGQATVKEFFSAAPSGSNFTVASTDALPRVTGGQGSLLMPETRSSVINDPVLVNPVYRASDELLNKFQANEQKSLEGFRELGVAVLGEKGNEGREAPASTGTVFRAGTRRSGKRTTATTSGSAKKAKK
ncbi:UvrD-helicase-domain-containing protein [Meredithblackwellia eburnea MCA 4105]